LCVKTSVERLEHPFRNFRLHYVGKNQFSFSVKLTARQGTSFSAIKGYNPSMTPSRIDL